MFIVTDLVSLNTSKPWISEIVSGYHRSTYFFFYLLLCLNVIVTLLSAIPGLAYMANCPEVNLAGFRTTYPGERYPQ